MAKNMTQAVLEAVQAEMRRDKRLTLLYEYQRPGLNLEGEFGQWRVRYCAIDEQWIVGAALGMAMIGVPAIAHIPSMATFIAYELMFNHAGKLRQMTGGQAALPMVLWADMAGRVPFQAAQHADAGLESSYAPCGAEGRDPLESLRRQGADDLGHSRRGPGSLLPLFHALVGAARSRRALYRAHR